MINNWSISINIKNYMILSKYIWFNANKNECQLF